MTDPIAALVRDLQRDGKPSLAWVVEWTERANGGDPVAAAWQASRDGVAMRSLLVLAGWGERDLPRWMSGHPLRGEYVMRHRACAPPTLAELMRHAGEEPDR